MSRFLGVSDKILGNILSRLPAKSFAAAACVNRLWNKVSDRILSRPRLASALSLAVSSEIALNEVLEMTLSKPIRPHFAFAFVGLQFSVREIHEQILREIGANTILVTSAAVGIIGVDSMINELKEVKWDWYDQGLANTDDVIYRGISLVIGFVPGLKIGLIPLERNISEEPEVVMVDKFISDVKNFTVSVSGDANPDPVGIMLFGSRYRELRPTLAEIDKKISRETVMIGDVHNYFICNGMDTLIYTIDDRVCVQEAVAIVFANDIRKPEIEIKFHSGISGGIVPMGPDLEIINVWELEDNGRRFSLIVTRVEGQVWPLDARALLLSLPAMIKDQLWFLYIGIKKKIIPQDGGTPIKYREFYEITGIHENMLIVEGSGINPGDICWLYHSDKSTAEGMSEDVYDHFNSFIDLPSCQASDQLVSSTADETEREKVFGGMVFASPSRGKNFSRVEMAECMPFCENFPGVPFGGTFCYQPIGRRAVSDEERLCEEERFNTQVNNSVFLAMSYKKTSSST